MTKGQKLATTLSVIAGVVIVIVISAFSFRKAKPGLYAPYKCNQQGDDSKILQDNWKARGAVCDGMYVPITAKLNGADYVSVLEWMNELVTNGAAKPTNMSEMKTLAELAAIEANK